MQVHAGVEKFRGCMLHVEGGVLVSMQLAHTCTGHKRNIFSGSGWDSMQHVRRDA